MVGARLFVLGLRDQRELVRTIDQLVTWDHHLSKPSPGERIQALILTIFMHQRPPIRGSSGWSRRPFAS